MAIPKPFPNPLSTRARVLLTSVFGPFARDDIFGSRANNPMELYHNQVTRGQGAFSLRMFHRSFGLMMLAANIEAPTTVLDFPTRQRFIDEIIKNTYDIVGIGGIIPNVEKVKEMCSLVRAHRPDAVVVVGGHVANIPDIASMLDADFIVKGDGLAWFRSYLGQSDRAVLHPLMLSAFNTRAMGISVIDRPRKTAAVVLPCVGCPLGCDFCATSAMFGGRGRVTHFFETGEEIFEIMCRIEEAMGVRSFFIMDENFLLNRPRALRILELMEQHDKSWSFYVFSSARVLKSYTMDQLVRIGISWVWMGLEGKNSSYAKLDGVDTHALVKELQSHGIRVLGSSIIGLEEHAPSNIDSVIEHAVSHDTDFHQFMLFMPVPGTELYARHRDRGTLLSREEMDYPDTHGQSRFNYRHANIPAGMEEEMLGRAFTRDFEENGPSLARIARTTLLGWMRYSKHPDPRVRRRFKWEAGDLPTIYAGIVWAARRRFRADRNLAERLDDTYKGIVRSFGLLARLAGPILGNFFRLTLHLEGRRMLRGRTIEPPTFYEKNEAAAHPALSASGFRVLRTVTASKPDTKSPRPTLQV